MTASLLVPLENFSSATSSIRIDLTVADTHQLGKDHATKVAAARTVSSSYVWLSAALEAFIKTSLKQVFSELQAINIPLNQACFSLCSTILASQFESLQDSQKLRSWYVRSTMLGSLSTSTPIDFEKAALPLDGRTLRQPHFETIWTVFGFPGPSLPHPKHKLALEDLADGRNKLAHGELDPVTFGRIKSPRDTLRLLSSVEDIATHFSATADRYMSHQMYLR